MSSFKRMTSRRAKIFAVAVTVILAAFAIALTFVPMKRGSLYLCEICPHNSTVKHDDVGFYSDYIVIANDSADDIVLTGYALSDDKNNLQKYVLPEVVAPAGGSVTVWAAVPNGISRPYVDEYTLYTGFKLGDNETLYFTSPAGEVIDAVRIPKLADDVAYKRNGTTSQWKKGTPTDYTNEEIMISDNVAAPAFSATSGFYDDLTLQMEANGCDIFYTLDGSNPYYNGVPYQEPLYITDRSEADNYLSAMGPISLFDVYMTTEKVDKATVVRAIARSADGSLSAESVATYFVGGELREKYAGRPILSMVVNPEDLFSGERGIYVTGNLWEQNCDKVDTESESFDRFLALTNYNMRGEGWRRPASVTLFDGSGEAVYIDRAKIGIRGNYTRYVNQKSFSLFPYSDGKTVFSGLFPDAGNSLMVRTGGPEDMFETGFRDEINNCIAENLDLCTEQSIPCQLFLNGEYWGCYNLQERLDETYVAAHYKIDVKNVNLIKNGDAVSGRNSDYQAYREMRNYVESHDFTDESVYRQFCRIWDIDNLIDYYCAEIFFANDDAYDNNIALWRARDTGPGAYEDGRWRFILFDTDCSDAYRDNCIASVDSFVDGHCRDYNPDVEFYFSRLSRNPSFREKFRERFEELLQSDFSYERIGPILDEMENTYREPMVLSVRRFSDPSYTAGQYSEKVEIVRDFFKQRGGYIWDYLELHMGD